MSGNDDIVNYRQDDYQNALSKIREINPLKDSGLFIGHKRDGTTVFLPGYYLAGYNSYIFGRVKLERDFLGIFGQLSDGSIVYLPIFNAGVRDAKQDLQNRIFIEAHLRELAEIAALKQREQERIQREAQEKQKDVQEKRELQRQLDELKDKLSKYEKDKNSTKSTG